MQLGINNTSFSDTKLTIGIRLQNAREKVGYSRPKLCDALNDLVNPDEKHILKPDAYKKWETGENPINILWIPPICSLLKIDVGYLFGEYEEFTRHTSDCVAQTGLSEQTVQFLQDFKTDRTMISFFDSFISYCGKHADIISKLRFAIFNEELFSENQQHEKDFSEETFWFSKSLKRSKAFQIKDEQIKDEESASLRLALNAVNARNAALIHISEMADEFKSFVKGFVKEQISKDKGEN